MSDDLFHPDRLGLDGLTPGERGERLGCERPVFLVRLGLDDELTPADLPIRMLPRPERLERARAALAKVAFGGVRR